MTRPDPDCPSPETLSAYADGELVESERQKMEQWLREHPEASAELEAHQAERRLWETTRAPEPTAIQWDATRAAIEAAALTHSSARQGPHARRPRDLRWLAWGAVASAAAVLFYLHLEATAIEEYPVSTSEEVEIISLDATDANTLVVGNPPVSEPLVLASPGDVTLKRVDPDVDGMVPRVRMPPDGPDAPMIVAPLEGELARVP